jgi:transposase-like protein
MNLTDVSKLTEEQARETFERIRWPGGPVCVHCGAMDRVRKLEGKAHRAGLYKCYDCGEQFTATVGTLLEDSRLPIRTWLMAFAILCSSKKGVSALQLQRQLGIGSYRSAWHMAHRIRHAMAQEPLAGLLKGHVEVDETYVGGKPRKGNGQVNKPGRGTKKTPVVVLVERGGHARARAVEKVNARSLKGAIRENVDRESMILTDDFRSYAGIGKEFRFGHFAVNHSAGEYVRGGAHTNTAESYFSLLKRGVIGSFHHVSKQHLDRYCNEFSFRWNHRREADGERTVAALKLTEGCRLMYRDPTKRPS